MLGGAGETRRLSRLRSLAALGRAFEGWVKQVFSDGHPQKIERGFERRRRTESASEIFTADAGETRKTKAATRVSAVELGLGEKAKTKRVKAEGVVPTDESTFLGMHSEIDSSDLLKRSIQRAQTGETRI